MNRWTTSLHPVWRRNVLATATLMLTMLMSTKVLAQDITGSETEAEATSGKISVPLSGRGLLERNSNLTVSPNLMELGMVEVGKSNTQTLLITHRGDQNAPPVKIGNAVLFGLNADEFTSDFNGSMTLIPGESVEVSVTLTPLQPGDKSAGMRLSIVDSSSPYILLFKGEARFALTSNLSTSDNNVNLGQTLQNNPSNGNFKLTNDGGPDDPAIDVSAIALSGVNSTEFVVDFQPQSLQPGETLDVNVSLDTSTAGIKSATAEVFHNGNNGAVQINLSGSVNEPQAVPVNFSVSNLNTSYSFVQATTLQFGPDNKLYVGERDGLVHIFDVKRNAKNNYSATLLESINLIQNVINHNDDGTRDFAEMPKRLLTGLHVTGSTNNPVIYAASSDPRHAGGASGNDSNLDTNSGILHKLTRNGGNWSKLDLVRGLPRSEEVHALNGLVLVDNKIYINIGGNTNQGVPSNHFAELPEYALSAAVLEIDLGMIGNSTYDIPTLDGPNDATDPFGGHDGLNQAKLVQNGPIKIFTTGLRNAYDIVYTETNRFYVWDNGPNFPWGGQPDNDCLNTIVNGTVALKSGRSILKLFRVCAAKQQGGRYVYPYSDQVYEF